MSEAAQIIGIVIAAMIGSAGLFIVASELHWCAYGRATLFWFAAYQFYFAGTRTFVMMDVVDREGAYILNVMGGAVFLTLLLNLIVIHWMWHRTSVSKRGRDDSTSAQAH